MRGCVARHKCLRYKKEVSCKVYELRRLIRGENTDATGDLLTAHFIALMSLKEAMQAREIDSFASSIGDNFHVIYINLRSASNLQI